ncbi:hypothetical protein K1T71_003099 [Dendrolimus kikuchii]|uniref:Uncharacterized protein n=1 Tax=Dendrolimus kikuchii TaxID=765133 RepID=A0ACC1DB79_9NEOP|nr:hypothetical protein K1T71_003099 [Dendrolimus kikuchii]
MAEPKFVIESGMQLLARLTKKPNIENFYPILFKSGPKNTDVIEISNDADTSWLLIDMISEALIPNKVNDSVQVLLIITDGNLNYELFLNVLRSKISNRFSQSNENIRHIETIIQETLSKLHLIEIFDANQFYVTIHNLDNILMEHSNISLVIFNSLTAFYWSEQSFKITKMDLYVKNLLQIIQKFIKEYKITCVYTRPQYFISSNTCEGQSSSYIMVHQYQINLTYHNDDIEMYRVDVKSREGQFTRYFKITDGTIKWTVEY